jgi:hypothetical protein
MEIKTVTLDQITHITSHPETKSNVMTFSKKASYLGLFIDNEIVGCVGYIEYKNYIKLKAGFVLPKYRNKGYYSKLCEERIKIVG